MDKIVKNRQKSYYEHIVFLIKNYEEGNEMVLKNFIKNIIMLANDKISLIFEDINDFNILKSGNDTQNMNKLLYIKYKYLLYLDENEI